MASDFTDGGNVYFDALRIDHTKGHILQEDHYYPFGANISALSSTAPLSKPNNFKYNEKEFQTEFDLNWYDYGARNYDPQLGRWFNVDPMSDSYYDNSTYHFSGNNPILFKDVDGRYYEGTDGKPVTTSVNSDGKIVLSDNASPDLQRMASLVNDSGSETAVSQFAAVGTNETKVNFQFSNEVVFVEGGGVLFGLHQAHDVNGNALEWDAETGTFGGEIDFITDSEGNPVYKEATITIFELAIGLFTNGEEEKKEQLVSTNAHENEHDLNKKDIKAIKERGEGKKNNRDVEKVATAVGRKVEKEINENN